MRSIDRFLEPEQALAAAESEELRFKSSRPMGGAWVLDAPWLPGIHAAIAKVAEGRKVGLGRAADRRPDCRQQRPLPLLQAGVGRSSG